MLATGTAALVGAAAASPAPGAPSESANEQRFVVGNATNRFAEFGGPVRLQVSAHLHRNGKVTGHARGSGTLVEPVPATAFRVAGEVTCVRIVPKPMGGAYASIKYVIR